MKTKMGWMTLAIAAVVTGTSIAHAGEATYICEMWKDAAPHYTFTINVAEESDLTSRDGSVASISAERHAFYGSEEMSMSVIVPGCDVDFTRAYTLEPNEIYLQCAGDGDAGVLTMNFKEGKKISGELNFPYGYQELKEETQILLTCKKW